MEGGRERRWPASLLRFTAVGKGKLPPADPNAWQGRRDRGPCQRDFPPRSDANRRHAFTKSLDTPARRHLCLIEW